MECIGDFEYNTKDLIGHGAFAVVYKGRHKTRNSLVAIKSITKKNLAKSQNLLGKEIKILKELTELHHENVVALLDCKETNHHVYLVMEFCNGGDLADYLHAKGTLSEDTIRSFLRQIAGAMRALYQKGVVHRDLKPQNILLCHTAGRVNPPPSEIVLKIADFGFARFLQDGVMAATLCGSPMYMAPEVIMSLQYDAKADLWSIGTIVFQCLTGKAPFQAQTPQALKQFYEKNANLVPKIPSDTSPDLTNLLLRLLKRNSKDRMEFDEFFNHPFLKPVTKLSSPMPVPHRRGSSPMAVMGLSPTDVPPSPRLSSWGENPMETASPHNNYPQSGTNVIRGAHGAQAITGDGGTLSSPDEQDFVFVPECLSNETSGGNICEISGNSLNNANTAYVGRNSPNPSNASRGGHHRNTEPVPVPTQKEAYEQIQRSLAQDMPLPQPSPPVRNKSSVAGSPGGGKSRTGGLHESSSSSSLSSEKSRGIPDLTSISPPSIQFVIGTPPGARTRSLSGSRSSSGTTPPPSSFIPGAGVIVNPGYLIHQTSGAAGYIRRNSLVRMNGNPVLSPILDFQQNNLVLDEEKMSNPTRTGTNNIGWAEPNRTDPCLVPFSSQKRSANDSYGCNLNQAGMDATSPQNPAPFQVAFGSGRAFTLPDMSPHHQQNFWPTGNGTDSSLSENRRQRRCQRNQSESHLALSSGVSPPHPISRCSSLPSNGMDAPLTFVAPELSEETLFEREHNETLAKLNFVLALVDCILELAESKATPFGVLTHSSNTRRDKSSRQDACQLAEHQRVHNQANNSPASSPGSNPNATSPILLASSNAVATGNASSDSYKRAEQLVLYMRALQLLSSSLQLSRQEVQAGKLRPSSSVRSVLKTMKHRFHECLETCKSLDSPTLLKGVGVDPLASSLTADRLLYDHAIEMCQSAALKELFGNPEDCFRHYQTAQILLHSLAQQVEFEDDKRVLLRYKDAVEKRLFVLQSQGFVCAYDATT